MLHNVRVLCSIDLRLPIKPSLPFHHDSTRIITPFTPWFLFPMQPPACPMCIWTGWVVVADGLPLHEPLRRSSGLNHVYPHPSLPPQPHPPSSSAREIDDSHLFFPPDSRVLAVPLIHPRDQPCNSVSHQRNLSLFALSCCTRNK